MGEETKDWRDLSFGRAARPREGKKAQKKGGP